MGRAGMKSAAGIAFSEWGKAGGQPALVLVHGSGGSPLDWPTCLRRLAGTHVIALDLPGHGSSTLPGRDRVEEYAADVAQLLQTLELGPCLLAGHSLGGAIVLHLALDYPQLVAGLVLVGTGARLRVHPDIFAQISESTEAVADLLSGWEYAPHASAQLRESTRRQLVRSGAEVLSGDYRACDRFDIMADLPRIGVPVLVMVGEEDRLTPVKFSRFLVEHLPRAKLAVIPDAGHMVALEQYEAVCGLVGDWVQTFSGNA